jgi:hypothetical protein
LEALLEAWAAKAWASAMHSVAGAAAVAFFGSAALSSAAASVGSNCSGPDESSPSARC